MDNQHIDECLLLYGADMASWPAPVREKLQYHIQNDAELERYYYQALRKMESFEALLASRAEPIVPKALNENILQLAFVQNDFELWSWDLLKPLRYAILSCFAIGICLGILSPENVNDDEQALQSAFSMILADEDFEE